MFLLRSTYHAASAAVKKRSDNTVRVVTGVTSENSLDLRRAEAVQSGLVDSGTIVIVIIIIVRFAVIIWIIVRVSAIELGSSQDDFIDLSRGKIPQH